MRFGHSAILGLSLCLACLAATAPGQTEEAEKKLCELHPPVKELPGERTGGLRRVGIRSHRRDREIEFELKLPPVLGGRKCTEHDDSTAAVGALTLDGSPHCTGTLVAPTVVLTAAHCTKNFDYTLIEFVVGLDADSPLETRKAFQGDEHDLYDPSLAGVYDLGVVYLSRPMLTVEPMAYRREPVRAGEKKQLLFVGYGSGGVGEPGTKRCVTIPVSDTCGDSFAYDTEDRNTCRGDSGGPALIVDGSGTRLAGVTAWGDEECDDFGISMDIGKQAHTDWLIARIADRQVDLEQEGKSKLRQSERWAMKRRNEIAELRGSYETINKYGQHQCRKVRSNGPKLAEKMRVLPDPELRPVYRILKYEYLAYMLTIAASVEPNRDEQLRLADDAIAASGEALRLADEAQDQAPSSKDAKRGYDYVVDSEVRPRVRWMLAKAQAIRRHRTGSPAEAEIQATLDAIPPQYLEVWTPDTDPYLRWFVHGDEPDEGCNWPS